MIEVTVKTLDGKNRAFSVPDEITVKQFKKTIAASIEIKAEIQRLIFKGRILCDDHKINDYDVNGKTIHVVQKHPPSSTASSTSTVSTGTSSDSLAAHSRDLDEIGRAGRRIFLGSYSLTSDGAEATTSSAINGSSSNSAAQNRGTNESQNRVAQIKKLIASAKRLLDLLESPNPANSANFDEGEQNDSTGDQSNAAEQGTSSGDGAENNPGSQNPQSSVISDLLDEVMSLNTRLQPHLALYQQLMRDETVMQKKTLRMDEAQQLCTLVPRALHFISHIYHNLSDLSVDVSAAPPRPIVAPPVHRQATTIFQQSIPVLQAEISLSGGPLLSASGQGATSTGTRTSSAPTEPSDTTAGGSRLRFASSLPRGLTTTVGSSSSSGTTSGFSSVFPLFLSSSISSSGFQSVLPSWLTATASTTNQTPSTSTASVSSAPSSSNVTLSSSTLTTDSLSRTGRRGIRRVTESSTRNRPTVSISTHDFGESNRRHFDPYLKCHSRHVRPGAATQQAGASTSNNSSQSLSDIISGLVSSIMTTPGEAPAGIAASGRHGNDDDIGTSFTTQLDSSLREFHEQLLDDPEIEEEVISTWHPLDSSSSFVRNIFGPPDRANDNARSNSRSFPRSTSVLEDFLNIMNSDSRSDENWLELLIRQILSSFSFSDVLSMLTGNVGLLGRARQPLQDFVRNTVLNGEEATDENLNSAVEHLMDDLYYFLEEMAGDADVIREVDFVASMISFLKHHMKLIFGLIMRLTGERELVEELPKLCRQMVVEFACLCEGSLRNDGFVSFVQNHLFFPYGIHSAIGSWVRDQLRCYRSSILPSPLQATVCERHIVFYSSLNSLNDSDASVPPENRTKERERVERSANAVGEADLIESRVAEQAESSKRSSSGANEDQTASVPVAESEKLSKDRVPGPQKASSRNCNDAELESPAAKRRKIANCDEEIDLEASSGAQTVPDRPRSSENGALREDEAMVTSATAESLPNGIDAVAAPPRASDLKDLSNSQQ